VGMLRRSNGDHESEAICAACGVGSSPELCQGVQPGRGRGQQRPKRGGGHLIACDGGCGRAFHLHCVGLRTVPVADWICGDCSAAPTTSEEDEGGFERQRPSQRRRAALEALQKRNWG
jgi:hypothetical protein